MHGVNSIIKTYGVISAVGTELVNDVELLVSVNKVLVPPKTEYKL